MHIFNSFKPSYVLFDFEEIKCVQDDDNHQIQESVISIRDYFEQFCWSLDMKRITLINNNLLLLLLLVQDYHYRNNKQVAETNNQRVIKCKPGQLLGIKIFSFRGNLLKEKGLMGAWAIELKNIFDDFEMLPIIKNASQIFLLVLVTAAQQQKGNNAHLIITRKLLIRC